MCLWTLPARGGRCWDSRFTMHNGVTSVRNTGGAADGVMNLEVSVWKGAGERRRS